VHEVIDKLTIANIRLWHLEDRRRDRTLSDSTRLEAADRIAEVNNKRNDLIDEIDALLDAAIRTGRAPVVKKHKLYQFLRAIRENVAYVPGRLGSQTFLCICGI
jgi:hypothetical protein